MVRHNAISKLNCSRSIVSAIVCTVPALVWAGPAMAHTGHVAGESGHSHWLAIGAAAVAVVIAATRIALVWRRNRARPDRVRRYV